RGVTTGAGFAVWEPVAVVDDQLERTLLILVPACRDGELVAWTWRRRDAAAPPLQRYLAGAAKVRYQWRVRDGGDAVRRLWDRIDERATRLRQLMGAPGPLPAAEAADVRQLVRRLRVDRAELTTLAARLTQMRRSVAISGVNMAAILRADGTSPGEQDLFAVDRRLAEHVVDQLDDDLVFLGAVAAGTEAALELVGRAQAESVDHGQIEDIRLTPEEQVELCTELAAVFGAGLRAAHLLEEIGLPRARQLAAAGAVPLEWWTEMLRELGNGAVETPYRSTLEAALRVFAYNRVFVRLARRHRLRGQ
ncbi:CATRA conflict system CASPASE/TPR repeat-associated protein, partial [Frankia tisae]